MNLRVITILFILSTVNSIFLLFVLIISYNVEPEWRYEQVCNDTDKRAKFIIDCIREANPMSDENGEDLVKQCDLSSRRLFCYNIKKYYN